MTLVLALPNGTRNAVFDVLCQGQTPVRPQLLEVGLPVVAGVASGQLLYWDAVAGQWVVTPTAPADGDIAVYDGIAQRWGFAGNTGERLIVDRFIGGQEAAVSGTNTSGLVSQLKWNTITVGGSGTVTRRPSSTGHVGVVRVASAITASTYGMYLGNSATGVFADVMDFAYLEFELAHVAETVRFGVGNNAGATGLGTEAFYIEAAPSVGSFWRVVSRTANVPTVLTTAVPLDSGNFHRWRIVPVTSTRFLVLVDGVQVADVSSGMPNTTLLNLVVQPVQTAAGGIVDVDTFAGLLAA